jgi:deoxyadenosine/deoxycytidine kinase
MVRRRSKNPAPRFIAIEGPVGVGKTTLARYLARRLSARAVFEEGEENPFLKSFYGDPRRFAFQTQLYFLLSRYKQQQALRQEDLFLRSTVADYVFQKDRVFAELTLSSPELTLYDRVYRMLEPRVPAPDLVVYLQARPEVLLERIRTRNRAFERPIRMAYLEAVVRGFNEFFLRYRGSSLLIINTSDIDFVEKDSHLESVLSEIRRMRVGGGVQVFNPKAA